ncbi:hypothetical protein [Georgenia sp. SUBG003]|uniref:hypothetical protein n=1 Tax=Georgenia sp. SUBG003 TaxID=1497974 RepID=UPI0004DA7CCE|nr:hypothetical protein DA06_19660 [Georgenia sp. SUBG003]
MSDDVVPAGTATAKPGVWVPTPPGWVEVAAFADDDRAREHWREMVEPARATVGDRAADALYETLAAQRREVAGTGVVSAGLVLTFVEDQAAVWAFTTTLHHVDQPELNPAGLVERAALTGAVGTVDAVTDLTMVDGRAAVQVDLSGTGPDTAGARGPDPDGAAHPDPHADGDRPRYGVCVVGLALPDSPHDLVLVTGAVPDVAQRELVAPVVQAVAVGVSVGDAPAHGLDHASGVLDATGTRSAQGGAA